MKVWKFLDGCVNIGIMGDYPERVVNRCIGGGVRIVNCQRHDWGLSADIRAGDFKRLRKLSRGCGARIRILSRRGGSRIGKKLRNSAVFASACLLLALAAVVASTRVWIIGVETVEIPKEEIYGMLSELGVDVGVSKRSFKPSEIAAALNSDRRIASARVKLSGVTLKVTVSESAGVITGERDDAPSSVFSDKDCVIRFISVSRGRARVSVGQAVKRGELLVTGDLSEAKEGLKVPADGLIFGEVLYVVSAEVGRDAEKPVRSGNRETVTGIEIFGREILLDKPYERYELEPLRETGLNAGIFPLRLKEYVCYEIVVESAPDSDAEMEKRARLAAQEKLGEVLPTDARIISISTKCTMNGKDSLTAVITVTTIERIGFRREI